MVHAFGTAPESTMIFTILALLQIVVVSVRPASLAERNEPLVPGTGRPRRQSSLLTSVFIFLTSSSMSPFGTTNPIL